MLIVLADTTIKLWSFASQKLVATLQGHTAEVTKVVWNRIIVKWVSASDDGTIRVWDEIGQPYTVIQTNGGISALTVDTTFGYVLAASSLDHVIRVYDVFAETVKTSAGFIFPYLFRLFKRMSGTPMLSQTLNTLVSLNL